MTVTTRRHLDPVRRAFSLVEMLMAIFILAIGIISIAALFPAGIAQQRQSVDDTIGPLVAGNAMAIIRTKLRADDFGTFESFTPFGAGGTLVSPRPTGVPGDFPWLRPGTIFEDDGGTDIDDAGAVDVFSRDWFDGVRDDHATEFPGGYSDGGQGNPRLYGIPYGLPRFPLDPGALPAPPRVVLTQRERSYPTLPPGAAEKPQYVWDCMFRRFQGRIMVAVFVYRVSGAGGESGRYTVTPNPGASDVPPLPIWLPIATAANRRLAWDVLGRDQRAGTRDDAIIMLSQRCDDYDPFDDAQAWQEPGQWLIDQNSVTHRVLTSYCDEDTDRRWVELVRPVPRQPDLPPYYLLRPMTAPPAGQPRGQENVVSDIWYLPVRTLDASGREIRITPVYLAVEAL